MEGINIVKDYIYNFNEHYSIGLRLTLNTKKTYYTLEVPEKYNKYIEDDTVISMFFNFKRRGIKKNMIVYDLNMIEYPCKSVKVFQTKDRRISFMDYDFTEKLVERIDVFDLQQGYKKVFDNYLTIPSDDMEACDFLYQLFNLYQGTDFKGRSLSMSDVIMIDNKTYYCNSAGFVLL